MFANAGMNQFKDIFTGAEQPKFPRAVTSQKCVRAGGKHNDLDNVGYTARHHTFFEMLGNFSFGDYFKEQAIELAWNLVTREFGLDASRLLVTVYASDDEAYNLWSKIAGLSDDKIIRIPTSDNFWSMGDTGPCGPCSEIFYDHGDHIWGGPPGSPEEDGDRFVEIWNLVFMQYEQISKEERVNLPSPSIDTGMGLERIAAVLQGVHDNYDIDLFQGLIRAAVDLVGVKPEGEQSFSYRVIADHLRTSGFLIADGVLPSKDGRGYVLRRIMRRAMRHAHLLGAEEPLIYRLTGALINEMGEQYPELVRARPLIEETLKLEEERFRRTLSRGLSLLSDATQGMDEGAILDGETAFKLYDTYGFPLDLTQDALRADGIGVDTNGFDEAMERQRSEARAARNVSVDGKAEKIWFDLRDQCGVTDFLGYESDKASGLIQAIVTQGEQTKALKSGSEGVIILNQTPFYGESGGQVGDIGTISGPNGALFVVTDTQKKADGLFLHFGRAEQGELKVGDGVDLQIDVTRRDKIRSNHSATHLLHEALRKTLGSHVAQKGSLVSPDRLRFDFSHQKPVSSDEKAQIEAISNQVILQNAPVSTRVMAVDDAIEAGAMALFGEKYGEEVRVVSMGQETDPDKTGEIYSLELCGGTHVERTGDIGLVAIVGEGAVSSGVRRIEALTGNAARAYYEEQDRRVKAVAAALRSSPSDIVTRIEALMEERKDLERELSEVKRALAVSGGSANGPDSFVRQANGTKYFGRVITGINPKDLRGIVDEGKATVESGVVAIAGVSDEGKVGIAVGVTKDLTDKFSAVDLVRLGSAALGGKGGGGRPDFAQAGGPDADKAQAAIETIAEAL